MFATVQSLHAYFFAICALLTTFSRTVMLLARLRLFAFRLTEQLFGASEILLDIPTTTLFLHSLETTRAVALVTSFETFMCTTR